MKEQIAFQRERFSTFQASKRASACMTSTIKNGTINFKSLQDNNFRLKNSPHVIDKMFPSTEWFIANCAHMRAITVRVMFQMI